MPRMRLLRVSRCLRFGAGSIRLGRISPAFWLAAALVGLAGPGCSVRQFALHKLGDALSESGSTFASDDDPDLIKDAAPFSLKLMESLLAETSRHTGLLLATARGFTQYAYAFVQEEADELEARDLAAANALRVRAKRLYVRARDYGLRGLDVKYPGFEKSLRGNPRLALASARKDDVPFLYWTAAAWASAITLSKDNPDFVADLPLAEALIDRALELDEAFDRGAIHSFLIAYESARPGGQADFEKRSRKHFARAMELSQGLQAAPLVSLAETVSVKNQNVAEFKSLLNQALLVDANAKSEWRLVNLVMQRRARWLLSRVEELFLVADEPKEQAK